VQSPDLSNIYSWGKGNSYRLGHGDKQDQPSPKLVETLIGKKIADVAAGSWHTVAVTADNGVVYSWGGCAKGQLGLGDASDKVGCSSAATGVHMSR
jgi:E3 ubiquitin-protein ligase HERC2